MATEVGVAYVRLLPSMRGFAGEATRGLGSSLQGPSEEAGRKSGRGFVTGLGSSLQAGGARISGLGDQLTKGLTLPLAGLGVAAFNASKNFNQGMANVATLIPGNTARVEELSTGVRELAIDMGKSTDDMSEGLYNVISAFGDSSESMSLLEINARAATGGMASTTDAINLTSAVTKGYGDTSAEAVQKASDLALLTVRMGQTTFPELAGSIGQVIPIAQNLGVTQEELFGSMAAFTGVTGSASEVATQMRGAMQSLQAPTADAATAFEEAGFASGAAAVEELGLAGAVGILTAAADASGEPLQNFMGSIEGQTFAMGLAGAQAEDYESKLGEMANAQGTTDEAFTEATEGVNAAGFEWEQAKAKANDLMIELGDNLAPAVSSLLDAATPLVDQIATLSTKFAEASPQTQKLVAGLLGLLVVMGPIMSIGGRLISTIGGMTKGVAALSRGSFAAAKGGVRLGRAFGRGGAAAARGVGRLTAGFRNAQAAESAFSGRLGTLGGKLRALPGSIGRVATSFGRLATQAGRATAQVVASGARMAAAAARSTARVVAQIGLQIARWAVLGVQSLLHAAKVALAWLISLGPIALVVAAVIGAVALIVSNWDKIAAAAQRVWEWISTNWPTLLAVLTGPFGIAVLVIVKNKDRILGAIRSAINWVKSNWPLLLAILTGPFGIAVLVIKRNFATIKRWATNAKDWITGRFDSLVSFVRRLPGRIASAASGMWNSVKNGFRDALNAIIGWWNGLSFTLGPFTIGGQSLPGPLPDLPSATVGPWTLSTPNLPMLAKGGIATDPMLAMIGEGGQDEAVLPLDTFWSRLSAGFGEVADTSATGLGAVRGQLTALLAAVRLQTGLITASQRASITRLIDWLKPTADHVRMARRFLDWTKNGIATLIEIEQFGARNVRVFEDLSGVPRMASGGIARYRPGGLMVNVAEQDDEAIAPLSDLRSMVVDSALLAAARMPSGPGAAPAAVVTLDVTGGRDDLVRLIASWVREKGRGDPVASLGGSR